MPLGRFCNLLEALYLQVIRKTITRQVVVLLSSSSSLVFFQLMSLKPVSASFEASDRVFCSNKGSVCRAFTHTIRAFVSETRSFRLKGDLQSHGLKSLSTSWITPRQNAVELALPNDEERLAVGRLLMSIEYVCLCGDGLLQMSFFTGSPYNGPRRAS